MVGIRNVSGIRDIGVLEEISKPRNIKKPKVVEDIKMNIVISKSKTLILFNSYLNIAILLRLIIYQPQ